MWISPRGVGGGLRAEIACVRASFLLRETFATVATPKRERLPASSTKRPSRRRRCSFQVHSHERDGKSWPGTCNQTRGSASLLRQLAAPNGGSSNACKYLFARPEGDRSAAV